MRREFSAGGVVVCRLDDGVHVAAITPGGKRGVWALPKGAPNPGESPAEAAVREVAEETGLVGQVVEKLGDVRYVYTWEGERVAKVVAFFLVVAIGGRLGDVPAEHAHEVADTGWLPLDDAPRLLSYRGERDMAALAQERVAALGL